MSEPARLLAWDTAWFGFPVARLEGDTFDAAGAAAVAAWAREQGVRVVYALLRLEPAVVRAAEDAGWRRVDTRLDFERPVAGVVPPSTAVRPGRLDDLAALTPVAAAAYRDSRFFADAGFPDPARCAAMYVAWLEGALREDHVSVAVADGKPLAYATRRGDRIGLVGVAAEARGRGLGRAVVEAAVASAETGTVRVATQARNLAAQRLYQRSGFVSAAVGGWYHRWFEPGGG